MGLELASIRAACLVSVVLALTACGGNEKSSASDTPAASQPAAVTTPAPVSAPATPAATPPASPAPVTPTPAPDPAPSRPSRTTVAELSWQAPAVNADGAPLTELAGYRIRFGQSEDNLDRSIVIDNPSILTYVVDNLAAGTWYFEVLAVTAHSVEGPPSNRAVRVIS